MALRREELQALVDRIRGSSTDPDVIALCEDNLDRLRMAAWPSFDKKAYMRKYMQTYRARRRAQRAP